MEKPSSANITQRLTSESLDWRIALFAIVLVEISSTRLAITAWVPFLYFAQLTGLAGVALGLLLGYSYFSRKAVLRIAVGYTLVLIPAQLLQVIEKTEWLWQDVLILFIRLYISFGHFVKGQPVYDQLFFTSFVTLGYWMLGLCAGYWLIRHKSSLSVILPSGLAMLIIQIFDPFVSTRIWSLAVYIFTSLLLLGRMNFLENRSLWKKTNFLLTPETIGDLERGALTVAAIAVFISWSMPNWISSMKPAAQAWNDFSQPILERLSDSVKALDSSYGKKIVGDFYSNVLALGQQAAIGDTPVFLVDVKENNFTPVRNYWKGRSYDQYIDGRWTTTSITNEDFNPDINRLNIEYPNIRHEMEFTFTNNTPSQNLLYAPAETIWVSRKGRTTSTPISENIKDVAAWFTTPGLLNGNTYRVRALIADPSIEELRAAGTEYPQWVMDRYLQIPSDIVRPLNTLTERITAPYDTPYDKAQAITAYLRKEITYTPQLTETPPKFEDPLIWVLFEYKKGFCMYYASAETLMLRSIGIPARMAVGFAQGTLDDNVLLERYIVTYKDSHAWPEVYFPGIGWVEFEPTANQAPLNRPVKNVVTNNPAAGAPLNGSLPIVREDSLNPAGHDPTLTEEGNRSSSRQTTLWIKFLLPSGIITILIIGIFLAHRYSLENRLPVYLANRYIRNGNTPPRWLSRWVRWVTLSPIERAFQAINFSLYWLKHPQPVHTTSQERANALISYLPSAQDQTLLLLQEYQATIYSPRPGNIASARKAATIILLKAWQTRLKKALKFPDTRYNQP